MTIDEIAEKSTITFPRSVDLKEAEGLLMYVAMTLPAHVHYNVHYFRSISSLDGESFGVQDGTLKIIASVHSLKNPMAFDTFHIDSSTEDPSRLELIGFQMVPGWELSDYRPEIRQLWGDTRRIVQGYFATREGIGNKPDNDEVGA